MYSFETDMVNLKIKDCVFYFYSEIILQWKDVRTFVYLSINPETYMICTINTELSQILVHKSLMVHNTAKYTVSGSTMESKAEP